MFSGYRFNFQISRLNQSDKSITVLPCVCLCVCVCARSFACTVFLGMCGCRYQTSDVVAHAKDSIREVRQYEVYYSAAALLEFH